MWPFPPQPHAEERPGQGPEWALPEARGLLWRLDTEEPRTPISLRRGLREGAGGSLCAKDTKNTFVRWRLPAPPGQRWAFSITNVPRGACPPGSSKCSEGSTQGDTRHTRCVLRPLPGSQEQWPSLGLSRGERPGVRSGGLGCRSREQRRRGRGFCRAPVGQPWKKAALSAALLCTAALTSRCCLQERQMWARTMGPPLREQR